MQTMLLRFLNSRHWEKADEEDALGSLLPPLSELSGQGGYEQMRSSGRSGLEASRPKLWWDLCGRKLKGPQGICKPARMHKKLQCLASQFYWGGPHVTSCPGDLTICRRGRGKGLASSHRVRRYPSVQTRPQNWVHHWTEDQAWRADH